MIPLLVILVSISYTAGLVQISCFFLLTNSGHPCEETPCFLNDGCNVTLHSFVLLCRSGR